MIFALILVIFSFFLLPPLVSLPTVVVWMPAMPLAHNQ